VGTAAALLITAVSVAGAAVSQIGEIVSEQFSGAAGPPSSVWTLSAPTGNPNGVATARLDGKGHLVMTAPAGSALGIDYRSYAPILSQVIPASEPANYEIDTELLMNRSTFTSGTEGGLIVRGTTNGTPHKGHIYPFTVSLGLSEESYSGTYKGTPFHSRSTTIRFEAPGGFHKSVDIHSSASSPVYLQLIRHGSNWTANYSLTSPSSPSSWTTVGSVKDSSLNGQNSRAVGLFVKAPNANPATAFFYYFHSKPVRNKKKMQ
jgi:hypothetical protein